MLHFIQLSYKQIFYFFSQVLYVHITREKRYVNREKNPKTTVWTAFQLSQISANFTDIKAKTQGLVIEKRD